MGHLCSRSHPVLVAALLLAAAARAEEPKPGLLHLHWESNGPEISIVEDFWILRDGTALLVGNFVALEDGRSLGAYQHRTAGLQEAFAEVTRVFGEEQIGLRSGRCVLFTSGLSEFVIRWYGRAGRRSAFQIGSGDEIDCSPALTSLYGVLVFYRNLIVFEPPEFLFEPEPSG